MTGFPAKTSEEKRGMESFDSSAPMSENRIYSESSAGEELSISGSAPRKFPRYPLELWYRLPLMIHPQLGALSTDMSRVAV